MASSSRTAALTAYGQNFRAGVYPIGVVPDEIQQLAEGYKAARIPCAAPPTHTPPDHHQRRPAGLLKGLVERFRAYEEFLDRYPAHRNNVEFLQIAPTSRSDVRTYQHIREQLESQAGHLNGRMSDLDWTPLHYLNKSYDRRVLMGLFRAADVGFVTRCATA